MQSLFEYSCPECGKGTVRTTQVHNYKTKIKGYPFVVDEAFIGTCDNCRAEFFTAKETKRWEEMFLASLEARKAFLSPEEIVDLRTSLGLSMEDFARLIGCTRQSISAWERQGRSTPPSRMADLFMKLVRKSLDAGPVDVLTFLLDEAKKWGVVIELRRPTMRSERNGKVVAIMMKRSKKAQDQEFSPLALAADICGEEEQIVAETAEGKLLGILNYDFERAALTLKVSNDFPPWKTFDVEIETQDGRRIPTQTLVIHEGRVMLLEKTTLRETDIARLTFTSHGEETER